jgi:hypothetical protein
MGLFTKLGEGRMKDPVKGVLRVVSIGLPNPRDTASNFRLEGVVSGDGVAATAVIHRGLALTNKWPNPGDELPVTVDRAKPDRIVIHWDDVRTSKVVAMDAAEKLAATMRAGGRPHGGVIDDHNKSRKMNDDGILKSGKPGTAKVLGTFDADDPGSPAGFTNVGLRLAVTVEGRPPWEVDRVHAVPDDKVSTLVVGVDVPIKANAAAADLVAIDWGALN